MLLGTDAMNSGVVPGFSAHDELAELVQAGLTPYEALEVATANAGAYLEGRNGPGTITPGAPADLLLLDADPLADIANSRRIAGVMSRGKWLSQSDIAVMLRDLADQ